jgi:hypothetical protein
MLNGLLQSCPNIWITPQGAIQTTGVGAGSVVGDVRGTGAIDLQTTRGVSSYVASGNYSFASGQDNTAGNYGAVALGIFCSATGVASFSIGNAAVASRYGEQAYSSGAFTAQGDCQTSAMILRLLTTTATQTEMVSPTRIALKNDSTIAFDVSLVARRSDVDNESASFSFKGAIDRNTNAASTAIVGTVSKTILARDSASWDATVDADTTNGSLRIQCIGEAGKTIRWVAFIRLVEVTG